MSTLKVNNIQSVTDGSVTFPQGSVSSQPVTFPSGTASNPSISFTNDSDTELYRIDANKIGISTGGNKIGEIGVGYGGFTGNVIQVQSVTYSTMVTITQTTPTTATGHTLTFTAKYNNSKLLIILNANHGVETSGLWAYAKVRNVTESVDVTANLSGIYSHLGNVYASVTYIGYYTVPNINANTYSVFSWLGRSGTGYYNVNGYPSILTIMEIQQ